MQCFYSHIKEDEDLRFKKLNDVIDERSLTTLGEKNAL